MRKTEQNIQELWDALSYTNICITGLLGEERK